MKRLALAIAVTMAVAATPAGAVSGGKKAPIANAPYLAWLPEGCTGTLIAPDRILTAGHCLTEFTPVGFSVLVGRDGNALVPFGANRFQAAIAQGGIPARGFSVNPGFKESFPFAHRAPQNAIALDDVGLILLSRPVTGITPVQLAGASDRADERVGAQASIFGYGLTGPSFRSQPRSLQTGRMSVISPNACGRAYPHAIIPSEICGQDLSATRPPLVQACPGDSGGPFIRPTANGPVQIGVTSWGAETMDGLCSVKPLPDVAMRVSSFASFLHAAKLPIEPYTLRRHANARIIAPSRRIGRTVSCRAPKLVGAGVKLSYRWQADTLDNADLKNGRRRTLKLTRAIYRQLDAARRIECTVTARNAGGELVLVSGSLHLGRL